MNLDKQIEAVLFFKGEALSYRKLASILNVKEDDIKAGLKSLKIKLEDRGIILIFKDDKVMLATGPEAHEIIESLKKEELSKDLGKASLESLSIVLYRGPVRKSEIDYIRGVNSATILRNLLVRGLVERKTDENNQRSFFYLPTFELLSYLGISELKELPEYEQTRKEIEDNQIQSQ